MNWSICIIKTKRLEQKSELSPSMDVKIWTKLIDSKSPFLDGDLKPYRWMFTMHRWNVLNIVWNPVDDHTAITTTSTRSSLC